MVNLMYDLYSMMDEEVHGAEEYAEKALAYKERMPDVAKMFDTMATDELKHATMLETEIKKAIDTERKAGKQVPPEMDAIYQFVHKLMNNHVATAKTAMSMYKGG